MRTIIARSCALGVGWIGIAFGGTTYAAIIGPDAYGYVATDEVPFVFENISATGTRVLAGIDDGTTVASLGFAFNFYGTNYISVSWSPNGLLTLGGTNGQLTNVNLNTSAPTGSFPSIAVLWDDWDFTSAGTDASYFQTTGPLGDRRFIVQWNNAEHFDFGPGKVTFQAVLFERDNSVQLNFLDVIGDNAGANNGVGATVGIRDASGQINGRRLQWSFNDPVIGNNQSIHFTAVPEPGTMGLLLAGVIARGVLGRKRRALA